MRRESGVAVLVVGLGVLAVYLVWSPGSGSVRPRQEDQAAAAPETPDAVSAPVPDGTPLRPRPERQEEPVASEGAGPAVPVGGLRFQVVDGATRQPSPEAEVHGLAVRPDDALLQKLAQEWPEDLRRVWEHGDRLVLDERAWGALDRDRGRVTVLGRAGDRLGWATWDAGGVGPVLLELWRRPSITVRAVDRDGAPVADAPVLWMRFRHSVFYSRLPQAEIQERQRTDGAGRAVFRHVPTRPDEGLRADYVEDEQGWFVGLELPGARIPLGLPVDVSHPAEEYLLEVPPTGSLSVVVQGPEGPVVDVPVRVQVVTEDRNTFLTDGQFDWVMPPEVVRWTTEGRATWSHVATEADLEVHVAVPDHPVTTVAVPRLREGEHRQVVVSLGEALPRVTGVARDEAGRPLADVDLLWGRTRITDEGPANGSDGMVRTDASGRFALSMDAERERRLWLGTPTGATRSFAACRSHGSAALPELEAGSSLDVGDVTLALLPLFHAGTVVDETGAPVAGAGVRAYNVEGSSWTRCETTTDAAGWFELRGRHRDKWDGGVQVQKPGYAAPTGQGFEERAEVVVEPGSEGRYELVRHGLLCGAWFLPANLPPSQVRASLPSAAWSFQGDQHSWMLQGPPGEVLLELTAWATTSAFASSEEEGSHALPLLSQPVVLPAPDSARGDLPRGPDLDLRGRLWCHLLELRDHQGQALVGGWVILDQADVRGCDRFGRILLLRDAPLGQVRVGGPHHRTRDVALEPGLSSTTVVSLEPGLPVRLEFTGAVAERVNLLGPEGLWCLLDPVGSGAFEGAAPGPGRLRVQVWPGPDNDRDPWEQEVLVSEQATRQVFTFHRDPPPP